MVYFYLVTGRGFHLSCTMIKSLSHARPWHHWSLARILAWFLALRLTSRAGDAAAGTPTSAGMCIDAEFVHFCDQPIRIRH